MYFDVYLIVFYAPRAPRAYPPLIRSDTLRIHLGHTYPELRSTAGLWKTMYSTLIHYIRSGYIQDTSKDTSDDERPTDTHTIHTGYGRIYVGIGMYPARILHVFRHGQLLPSDTLYFKRLWTYPERILEIFCNVFPYATRIRIRFRRWIVFACLLNVF